jgi:hypothetical protein
MNAREFILNSSAMPAEERSRYENKHVAYSEDGKTILAAAPSLAEVFAELNRRGVTKYVVGFIPPVDESCLGGAMIE